MKNLIMLTVLLNLVSCGGEREAFQCDDATTQVLDGIRVGENISEYDVFKTVKPSVKSDVSSYSEQYTFNQYNTDTLSWCYYSVIDSDENGEIVSVDVRSLTTMGY